MRFHYLLNNLIISLKLLKLTQNTSEGGSLNKK